MNYSTPKKYCQADNKQIATSIIICCQHLCELWIFSAFFIHIRYWISIKYLLHIFNLLSAPTGMGMIICKKSSKTYKFSPENIQPVRHKVYNHHILYLHVFGLCTPRMMFVMKSQTLKCYNKSTVANHPKIW